MTKASALVTLTKSTFSDYFGLYFRGDRSGDPVGALIAGPGAQVSFDTTTGCTSGKWHHACVVFATNTSRTVYLDGGSATTNTTDKNPSGINEANIAAFSGAADFAPADISDVGLWNASLTSDEVISLSLGMTCDKVRPQNLVFYSPLVRNLQDIKGGLTITNNNTATVANHPRVYA